MIIEADVDKQTTARKKKKELKLIVVGIPRVR